MPSSAPRVSVIVPVHNGSATLAACLHGLSASHQDTFEVIVVDDRSTDDSASIARACGTRIVQNRAGRGPAAARNAGAGAANGDILLFVDADVLVDGSSIGRVIEILDADPSLHAVFGSYDDEPSEQNFVSQYKNLFHHFTHQTARAESTSFWGGYGAIRRATFTAVGGFDDERYTRPSTEDIELGLRLARAGFRVRLDRTLQVKHLKRWTYASLIRTDIVDRAYPWATLLLSRSRIPDDLNLRWQHRMSAILVAFLMLAAPFLLLGHRRFYGLPVGPTALVVVCLALVHVLVLNREFYRFLLDARGVAFMLRAIPLHFCYYFYSGATFAWCWFRRPRRQGVERPAPAAPV